MDLRFTSCDLAAAERMAKAADRFVDPRTGRYHDKVCWSHLLDEADGPIASPSRGQANLPAHEPAN